MSQHYNYNLLYYNYNYNSKVLHCAHSNRLQGCVYEAVQENNQAAMCDFKKIPGKVKKKLLAIELIKIQCTVTLQCLIKILMHKNCFVELFAHYPNAFKLGKITKISISLALYMHYYKIRR